MVTILAWGGLAAAVVIVALVVWAERTESRDRDDVDRDAPTMRRWRGRHR